MTAREMHIEFETSLGLVDSLKINDFNLTTVNIEYFLNEAQHVFVNQRLSNIKENLNSKQKDLDDLAAIYVKDTTLVIDSVATALDTSRNVYTLPTSPDYLFLINSRSTTSFCGNSNEYENRITTHEDLYKILKYKYTSTIYNSPVATIDDTNLYIYLSAGVSTFTVTTAKIDYIRTYANIDITNSTPVDCELNANVHKEIVQLAVTLFLESINSDRLQTNVNKNMLTEQIK